MKRKGCVLGVLAAAAVCANAWARPMAVLNGPGDWKGWRSTGSWQWNGDWVGGQGSNAWQYAEIGKPKWRNYRVDLALRIDSPTDRRDPKWEGGGWVWAHYRNNRDVGGYEAGIVLRKAGADGYRVMFSVPFQEVMLWSSQGGFLQVVPCALATAKVYQVSAAVQDRHLTVSVDGAPVIDYWDRTAPLTAGSVALGLHEGTAYFGQVSVTKLGRADGDMPAHAPAFHFREWKGARWAWDGQEPIFLLNGCHGEEAKLVPGYQPQMGMYWYWINYGDESFYADKVTDFKVHEEGPRLHFTLTATDKKDKAWLVGRTDVTVTYDAARNRYVYAHVSDLIVPEGHSLKMNHPVEFTDPVIHGHVGSASPQTVDWETPHPWSVYKHVSGKLHKLPHNHELWYPGYGKPAWTAAKGGHLDPQGGFWALVGDPVANPVLTVEEVSETNTVVYTEMCGWAYDVHMRWWPVKPGQVMQPGTYTVKWNVTAADGRQGDQWLADAEFCAPENLDAELLLYTGGIGHVERFGKVVKHASPFGEYRWGDASLLDTTVGHSDRTSLKLVGSRSAGSVVGGSVYSDRVQEGTRYEVSAWVKTQDVRGEGPVLSFGGQSYCPVVTGSTDWQRIGFVCTPNPPLHTVSFSVANSGSGTLWVDDFMIRPLDKDEKPAPPIHDGTKTVARADAAPDQRLAWASASDAKDQGRTLLDLSGHGNHGRLEQRVSLADEDGKRVIEVNGDEGYVTTDASFPFQPPQTLSIWVKPGRLTNDWNMVATGGAWNRAWHLFLFYKQAPYSIDFRPWGRRLFTGGVVPTNQWTHLAAVDDGQTVRLYVNGELAKEEAFGGSNWAALPGPLVLGTWVYYDKPSRGMIGRLADCAYWGKALDQEAIRALFQQGPK